MSRHFTAIVLLNRPWPLDIDRVADALRLRYPAIGQIDAVPGHNDNRDSGVLTIDRCQIVLQSEDERVADADLELPLKTVRSWNPTPAVRTHAARLSVTCGGRLPGLEGAKAYAAATQFVTAAVADVAPAEAVLWRDSRTLVTPTEFARAADLLLTGPMPVGCWVSYAPVVPKGWKGSQVTGMVTYGLRPFLGREIELAPRPGDAKAAYHCLNTVVRAVLDSGLGLTEGKRITDEATELVLTVRARNCWLRRDQSAFVLVAEDAVVDRETLQPLAPAA